MSDDGNDVPQSSRKRLSVLGVLIACIMICHVAVAGNDTHYDKASSVGAADGRRRLSFGRG